MMLPQRKISCNEVCDILHDILYLHGRECYYHYGWTRCILKRGCFRINATDVSEVSNSALEHGLLASPRIEDKKSFHPRQVLAFLASGTRYLPVEVIEQTDQGLDHTVNHGLLEVLMV